MIGLRLSKIIMPAILLLVSLVPSNVAAISADDRKSVLYDTVFYDAASGSGGDCTSDKLTGSENLEKGFNFFLGKGLTPMQTAAIIGNFSFESTGDARGLDPTATNPGSGAHGIAQWLGGRLIGLQQFATSRNLKVDDLATQLSFAWHELTRTPESVALEALKKETNLNRAVVTFERLYERSGDSSNDGRRIAAAKFALEKYGGNADSGDNCAGEIVGGVAWPLAKKWWDEHPDWFTKPHHDYAAADIPVPSGTKVYSMIDGKVVIAGGSGACGEGVFVVKDNIEVGFCHGIPGSVRTNVGAEVKAGQFVMLSDNTGSSTGPHLHVQIKVNGVLRCPQQVFQDLAKGKASDFNSLPASGCSY